MTPDDETIEWIFDMAKWWLQSFGGFQQFAGATSIVRPIEEDFPIDLGLEGHELVEDYFEFAREHARLADWPFLMVDRTEPNVADALRGMPHHMTSAAQPTAEPAKIAEGDPLTIPYEISLLDDTEALVAAMARGMSHYLLYDAPTELPVEPDEREYVVDLGAVFLGFGVFLANSAFRFKQTEAGTMVGWGYSRRGALSVLDLSYTLALVATLLDVPDADVVPHLSANPKGFFRSGRRQLKMRRSDLERLRAISTAPGGPYR